MKEFVLFLKTMYYFYFIKKIIKLIYNNIKSNSSPVLLKNKNKIYNYIWVKDK